MDVRIDPGRLREVISRLAGMSERIDDFTVPLTAGIKRARADTLRDFETAGAFSGEPWKDLAASTRVRDQYEDKRVSAMGRPTSSHEPLILSGRFRNSVTYFVEKFIAGVRLGPAYWLNFFGTTNPVTGALKNPPREAGYISIETINWTLDALIEYTVEGTISG